jgi:predicted nucleic acid-binding protein
MIIIDTNVVSEMMRNEPDPTVLAWTATAGRLHTTAVTLAEIEYGTARLSMAQGPGGVLRRQSPRRMTRGESTTPDSTEGSRQHSMMPT